MSFHPHRLLCVTLRCARSVPPGEGWSQDVDSHWAEIHRGGAQSVQTGTSAAGTVPSTSLPRFYLCPPLLNCLKQNQQAWRVASCKPQQLCGQDTTGWLKEKQHLFFLFFFLSLPSPISPPHPSQPLWVVNRNVKLSALGCISRLVILIVGPLCHCCFALHCHAAQCGGTTKGWMVGAGPHQTCHMSDRLGSAVNAAPYTAKHSPAQHSSRTHRLPYHPFVSSPSIPFFPHCSGLLCCSVYDPTLRFFSEVRNPFFSSPFHLWLAEMTHVSVSQWWCHWLLWRDCPVRALLCGSSSPAVARCLVCRHTRREKKGKKHISCLPNKNHLIVIMTFWLNKWLHHFSKCF